MDLNWTKNVPKMDLKWISTGTKIELNAHKMVLKWNKNRPRIQLK